MADGKDDLKSEKEFLGFWIDPGLVYIFLRIFLFIFNCADVICDLIFGYSLTNGWRQERKLAERYQHSAHIVKIRGRMLFRPVNLQYLTNFVYTHEKYVNPETILNNERIVLFMVYKDFSVFSMTDETENLLDTKTSPFLYIYQYEKAQRFVILPNKSFHRLAREVGVPKVPVNIIHHPGRTGSTLLSQMFKQIPNAQVISEPSCFLYVHWLRMAKQVTQYEHDQLMDSSFSLLCKIAPDQQIDRITIKSLPWYDDEVIYLAKKFSNVNLIFSYRHPKPCLKSLVRTVGNVEDLFLYSRLKLGYLFTPVFDKTFSFYPFPNDDVRQNCQALFKHSFPSHEEFFAIYYGLVLLSYHRFKHLFKDAVLYEDLVENPTNVTTNLFQRIGVPIKYVPTALRALKTDSQKEMFKMKQFEKQQFIIWESVNELFQVLGLNLHSDMAYEDFKKTVYNC